MKRLLVFGIGGFVGRYLADEFERSGYDVYGSDIAKTGSIPTYVRFQTCDILNSDAVAWLIREVKPTHIINLAAISSVAASWTHPQKTVAINVEGALNILEGAHKCDACPKILMIGSSEEYAISDKPIREDFPLDANNPYGLSKVMQERFINLYQERRSMQIYQVRSFNHIGVGQSPTFVIPSWCEQAARIASSGKPGVMKVGNLNVKRDLSDVRDIVRAYRMIIESDDYRTIYNVGSGTAYSLHAILESICSFSEQPIEVLVDPELIRPVDNPVICCDHTLLSERLGWQPEHILSDTLHEIYETTLLKRQ